MGQLDDLKASLEGLDNDEILAMVRKSRANRRISKKKPGKKKAVAKKPKESIEQVLAKMPEEERIALLAQIAERLGSNK